jgi:hypothetical protein
MMLTPLTTFQKLTTNFDIVNSSVEKARKDREERKKRREGREREEREKEEQEAKEKEAKEKSRESSLKLILKLSLATVVLGLFAK